MVGHPSFGHLFFFLVTLAAWIIALHGRGFAAHLACHPIPPCATPHQCVLYYIAAVGALSVPLLGLLEMLSTGRAATAEGAA